MAETLISVIIPTYNRAEILCKTLVAYQKQNVPLAEFEILVIDDGSTDHTRKVMEERKENYPITLKFLTQNHQGANAARNQGIQQAHGKLLLFTGDDIIPEPDFLKEHLARHQQYQLEERIAVLGFTTWHPDINITPLMKYLEDCSFLPQFEYNRITHPEDLAHEFFYTSNISVHRTFLLKNGIFDEEMNKPFADDGELALRLRKKGLRIVYHPAAKAYHWHEIHVAQLYKRAQTAGEMSYLFWKKHPELGKFPPAQPKHRIKQWIRGLAISKDREILENADKTHKTFLGNPKIENAYRKVLMKYYQKGIGEGIRHFGRS